MTPTFSALRFFATNGGARSAGSHLWLRLGTALFAFLVAATCATDKALADEDGVSFWLPGFFGSLAAVPQQPGWSLTSIFYNTNVSASGNAAVAREITIGRFNPKINISVNANVHANAPWVCRSDLRVRDPVPGRSSVSHPPFRLWQQRHIIERDGDRYLSSCSGVHHKIHCAPARHEGFTDLIPIFTDRWNAGVNNYMVYLTGDIPVGLYSSSNLANIGIGHGAIDGGVGYTYFDEKAGHEFSAVGIYGKFGESFDGLHERHRCSSRLGRFTVFVQATASRPCWILLRAARP